MSMALYRKYRPLTFHDVIGQPAVTDTLRRQAATGKTSHAYLFTGTRGTGKTTCAKILARAVNCENPADGDPCNVCPACVSILNGGATDVLEMDAASHSGVDNIRALREEFVYSPVNLKRRVYIIDEVHMLSTGAFNALLKSMEEPPEHVLFILATTETHKVPATILSRCQRFSFRRLSSDILQTHILHIAEREHIDIREDAAGLLAKMADGAARDALSLLDQCAALADGFPIDTPLVHEALGLAGTLEIADWISHIASQDAPAALRTLESLYQDGKELGALLDAVSQLLRDVLMAHMLSDANASSRLEPDMMRALASKLPAPRLISMIRAVQDTQSRLAKSPNRRIEAELCILRLCGMAEASAVAAPVSAPMSAPKSAPKTKPAPQAHTASDDAPPWVEPSARESSAPKPSAPEPSKAEHPPVELPKAVSPAPTVSVPKTPADSAKNAPSPESSPEQEDLIARIRTGCPPLYRAFLDGAKAEPSPGGLILHVRDEFCAMNLKTDHFTQYLTSVRPGLIQIRVLELPACDDGKLENLLKSAGSLITIEDDD